MLVTGYSSSAGMRGLQAVRGCTRKGEAAAHDAAPRPRQAGSGVSSPARSTARRLSRPKPPRWPRPPRARRRRAPRAPLRSGSGCRACGSAVAARFALQRLDATRLLHGHERTHRDQHRQGDTDPGPDRGLVPEDREELDDREYENQRAQQGAGHRSRHGQRDVHRCQAHDQPGEDDDRQKPDDEPDPAPTAEGCIDSEVVGEPPNVEVLPWEKEIDEEEHCSHEHQLCSAPEGVESLHAARPFVVVCGGLTGTLMHRGRSCKRERTLS